MLFYIEKILNHIHFFFFLKKNIPYKLNNRIGFFDTKIIQNIFAYLKFINNPNSDYYLKKIINYPSRNINEFTQNKLFSLSNSKNVSGWEIIKNCDNKEKIKEYGIDKELQLKLLNFKKVTLHLTSILENKTVYKIVYELIEYLQLKYYLRNNSSSIEKINMLLDKIAEMEEEHINFGLEKYDLNEFLDEMSIFLDNEDNSNNDNKVQLMTIHQAKGLEFKYVFIVGLEEGNYPCYCCDCEENDEIIDEERRILYVAITRAKIKCYISYAKERTIGEIKLKRKPSRFIQEIYDKELVEISQPSSYKNNNENENKIQNIEINKDYKNDDKKNEIKNKINDNKINVNIDKFQSYINNNNIFIDKIKENFDTNNYNNNFNNNLFDNQIGLFEEENIYDIENKEYKSFLNIKRLNSKPLDLFEFHKKKI